MAGNVKSNWLLSWHVLGLPSLLAGTVVSLLEAWHDDELDEGITSLLFLSEEELSLNTEPEYKPQ